MPALFVSGGYSVRPVSARLDVPELVRQKAAQRGVAGVRWLRELPEAIAELESAWDMTVGRSLGGGSESYVAEATLRDGTPAVLRIQLPPDPTLDNDSSFETSAWIHGVSQGDAYARLLRSSATRRALLLERLGPSLAMMGLAPREQLEALSGVLRRAWRVEPAVELEPGDRKAHRLAAFISATWEELGRPCSDAAVTLALTFCESRASAFDPAAAVVVHGDAHPGNALRASTAAPERGSDFKLVDPECFLSEPAYDLGVAIRDSGAREARELCAMLAHLTDVPSAAIWEWSFVERVSTGLFALQIGAERMARELLTAADVLAAEQ